MATKRTIQSVIDSARKADLHISGDPGSYRISTKDRPTTWRWSERFETIDSFFDKLDMHLRFQKIHRILDPQLSF